MSHDHAGGSGDGTGPADVLSHRQLLEHGERAADALARLGVGAGDAVAVQLPMCLESVALTVGIVQLGARRLSLPIAGPPTVNATRLGSSGARVAVVADACRVDGTVHGLKHGLDRLLVTCPDVHTVIVVPHCARPVPWSPGRDMWWHEALGPDPATAPPYPGGMTTPDHSGPARPEQTAGLVFDDPLERRSADDLDEGWGERIPDDSGQGDLVRFLREKPPHHI